MTERALIHCNDEVLHAPGICTFCDDHPDRQAARLASGGGFTPPEANGWQGNVAQPVIAREPRVGAGGGVTCPEPPPEPIEIKYEDDWGRSAPTPAERRGVIIQPRIRRRDRVWAFLTGSLR